MIFNLFETIFMVYGLWCILSAIYAIYQLKKPKSQPYDKTNDKYLFIFSVYKEQKIIFSTLEHYRKFLHKSSKIDILFVCSNEGNVLRTTYQIVQEYIKQTREKKIHVINCNTKNATKAIKINYALNRLGIRSYDYIVIFDADARVKYEDFLLSQNYIKANRGGYVYSFTPLPSKNSGDLFVNMHRLNHFIRTICFEISKDLFPSYTSYPMGATMIIKKDFFTKIKSIPEPIDDIPLGYVMTAKKMKFITLPLFTHVQSAPNIYNLFRSYIPIYTGVFSIFHTFDSYKMYNFKHATFASLLRVIFIVLEYSLPIWGVGEILISGNYYIFVLFIVLSSLVLYSLDEWSLANLLYSFFGHFIKLGTFIYYLFYKLFKPKIVLSGFKTERT